MNKENNIRTEINNLINNHKNGNISLLDVVINLRQKRQFFEEILGEMKKWEKSNEDLIQNEALQYENKYKGASFEFRSGGKIFDYKGIKEIDELEKELKNKKELYKTAWENKQKGLLAVTEDGEELQLPNIRYRAGSMIVKLPKN